jgi:hypothetical protein
MAEDIKASVVDEEVPSIAEKEEQVLENAGVTVSDDGTYKVDLTKINQQEDAVQEQKAEDGVLRGSSENEETGQETKVELQEVQQEEKVEETPVLEEVVDDETSNDEAPVVAEQEESQVEQIEETKVETKEPEINLPENIQDLVKFMEETGGSLEDYVRLNADYTNVDENTLLVEYYKQTKPHLSYDEIQFLMEDKFSFDEEVDEDRDIKRKKLALKEEVANAKNFLTGLKDQYYKEVKLGSKLLPEQQKAIDFFDRYNKEQKQADELLAKQASHFEQETKKVFNNDFKGFNFNVGNKKYRFNVKDVDKVKSQNLSNVFDKYVNENNLLNNAADFHKSLFAASNPDALANHFYEQGKADAIKQMSAEAKNINMDPRKTSDGIIDAGGVKVRAISGDNNSKLKFKLKNY